MSFRNKIILILILISFIAVLATGLLVLQSAIADKKNYITELSAVIAPQISNSLDQKIKNLLINLNELNSELNKPANLKSTSPSDLLKKFKNRTDGISAVLIKTKTNKFISFAITEGRPNNQELSILSDSLIGLKNIRLSTTQLSYYKDNIYLYAFDTETFVAVLFDPKFFNESFELAKGKTAYLVTHTNTVLHKTDKKNDLDSLILKIPSSAWTRPELVSLDISDQAKNNYFINFSRNIFLSDSMVMLVAAQPDWTDLTAPIVKPTIGLFLLLIIFSFAMAYVVSRSLAKPIEELSNKATRIGQGDWTKIELYNSGSEILKLTNTFNQMIENLKGREADLKIAHNKIMQAESLAAVGRMAAGIAHEVKNPLSSILGYGQMIEIKLSQNTELLTSTTVFEKIKEYVGFLLHDTRRANKIISDLLTFSRQKALQTNRINFINMLENFKPQLTVFCESQNVVLIVDISKANDQSMINVDVDQIYQVIFNLIQNATHALSSKQIYSKKINVQAQIFNSQAEISVIDYGEGIAPENIKKIFEPFFSTKKVGEGTGLGLSLCYGIIEQHNGHIEVTSELGIQTCFKIRLPLTD